MSGRIVIERTSSGSSSAPSKKWQISKNHPSGTSSTARLIQLSELMGFRVDQIGQGDGKGEDDDG